MKFLQNLQVHHRETNNNKNYVESSGNFTKFRQATISFAMSVCLSNPLIERNNSAPNRRFCMKFLVWEFFEKVSSKSTFL